MIGLLLAAAIASAPTRPAYYPAELLGAWHIGTAPCRLPEAADSDGLITIRRAGITAYESSISAYSIRRTAARSPSWRLDEFEDYEGETRRFRRTISLSGDRFIATEDGHSDTYTHCTRSPHR